LLYSVEKKAQTPQEDESRIQPIDSHTTDATIRNSSSQSQSKYPYGTNKTSPFAPKVVFLVDLVSMGKLFFANGLRTLEKLKIRRWGELRFQPGRGGVMVKKVFHHVTGNQKLPVGTVEKTTSFLMTAGLITFCLGIHWNAYLALCVPSFLIIALSILIGEYK